MQKQKYLRITMEDGSKWDVPASVIAKSRADYYAIEIDKHKLDSDEYKEELNYSYQNDDELKDWAANNMNWDDVKDVAVKVEYERPEPDYQEGWINGEREIVEY